MDDNKILKIVYTFFLGLILALFVGLGISTFYPSPQAPDFPRELNVYSSETNEKLDAERQKAQQKFDDEQRAYTEKSQSYNRNVSIIALVSAVALVAISLLFEKYNRVIANGVMLGGLFTLLYSLGRGLASEDTKYTFIAATVGLLIALYLGYRRFSAATTPVKKSSRK